MLQKRQVILVGLMLLALGYAAFDLLSRGDGDAGKAQAPTLGQTRQETAKTVELVTQMLAKTPMTEEDHYRVELVRRDMGPSPFYATDGEFYFPGESGVAEGDGLRFKGYVRVGDKILAVINGVEYAVGEEIEGSGFVLSSIQQSHVELSRKDGARGATRKLPLAEDTTKPVDVKVGR